MAGSNRSCQMILACQIILATLLLSCLWTTEAQTKNAQKKELQQDDEFRVVEHVPLVLIDAQVRSRTTGLPVTDLRHTDFVVSENGIQQAISTWEQGHAPVSLLILIDGLDAHNNRHVFDNQIQALKSSLATYLHAEDKVSVLVIADGPVVLQDFTTDKELVSVAFERLSQHKIRVAQPVEKRYSEALQQAAKQMRAARNPKARNVIVLVSNMASPAADNVVLPEKVVRAIAESASSFCWNGPAHLTTDLFDPTDLGEVLFGKVSIGDLVRLTGGEALGGDWESFIERLRERHRIGYVPLPLREMRGGELVRIKLQLRSNLKQDMRDLVLIYPRFAVIPSSRRLRDAAGKNN